MGGDREGEERREDMAFVILCFLSSTVPAVMLAKAAEVIALVTRKINGFFVLSPPITWTLCHARHSGLLAIRL